VTEQGSSGVRRGRRGTTRSTGRAVFDAAFSGRVRALLRTRPLAEADRNRQAWSDQQYDTSTLALAAIDAIIARQGFDDELTYDQATDVLIPELLTWAGPETATPS